MKTILVLFYSVVVPFLFTLGAGCRDRTQIDSTSSPIPDHDGDGVVGDDDCDDNNADIYPGANDTCDGIDNDCDALQPESLTVYLDADLDQYGYEAVALCYVYANPTLTYATQDGDCADNDASIYPSASEVCDTRDNDCDAFIDEDVLQTFYLDADGDGYGINQWDSNQAACSVPDNYASVDGDCNDNDSLVLPESMERCNDIDDNCNGFIDEANSSQSLTDLDQDGVALEGDGISVCSVDCDDQNASIYPGAVEICNSLDDNCDGTIDEDLYAIYYADSDGDGYGDAGTAMHSCVETLAGYVNSGTDCVDSDASIHPTAREVCNGFDDDCNSIPDDGPAPQYFPDDDGDGFGDELRGVCSYLAGYIEMRGDCDDTDLNINPMVRDVVGDVIDHDCGGTDDADAAVGLRANNQNSYASIQEALTNSLDGSTVWVASGSYNETFIRFEGKNVRLASVALAPYTIISGQNTGAVFWFDQCDLAGAVVDGFTITKGNYAGENGGGAHIEGSTVTFQYCTFRDNQALSDGGAIFADDAWLLVQGCTFSQNIAERDGGALAVEDTSLYLRYCTFDANSSTLESGGALEHRYADIQISFSDFTNNRSAGDGGAVSISSATTASIVACEFSNNEGDDGGAVEIVTTAEAYIGRSIFNGNLAGYDGGAVVIDDTNATMTQNYFAENQAGDNGGAVEIDGKIEVQFTNSMLENNAAIEGGAINITKEAQVTIDRSSFTDNWAEQDGGAFQVTESRLELSNSTVESNFAQRRGGAFYASSDASLRMDASQFRFNSSGDSYGLGAVISGSLLITNSLIEVNTSYDDVGGILCSNCYVEIETTDFMSNVSEYGEGGALSLSSSSGSIWLCSFSGNTAQEDGGAIYFESSNMEINDSYFADNEAKEKGGAVAIFSDSLLVQNSTFERNLADDDGGAIYADDVQLTIAGLELFDNQADRGGALALRETALEMNHTEITGNFAETWGAGLYLTSAAAINARYTVITQNEAAGTGGALYIDESSPILEYSVVTANRASDTGGIYIDDAESFPVLNYAILAYNRGYNLNLGDSTGMSIATLSYCDLYNKEGDLNHNLGALPATNLMVDPQFLAYTDGDPSDLHLSLSSPLRDLGTDLDPDGSPADVGIFGGNDADQWDRDRDGINDYFWPGQPSDAPTGIDPDNYDCDDSCDEIDTDCGCTTNEYHPEYGISSESSDGECNDFSTVTNQYSCTGGMVMKICGTVNSSGYIQVKARKTDGSTFGTGYYHILVYDPNNSSTDSCANWNVEKETDTEDADPSDNDECYIAGGDGDYQACKLSDSKSLITFDTFDSLLDDEADGDKAYCVTKEAGSDIAYWCSSEIIATYQ